MFAIQQQILNIYNTNSKIDANHLSEYTFAIILLLLMVLNLKMYIYFIKNKNFVKNDFAQNLYTFYLYFSV